LKRISISLERLQCGFVRSDKDLTDSPTLVAQIVLDRIVTSHALQAIEVQAEWQVEIFDCSPAVHEPATDWHSGT
jgi:hypothetical protein